MRTKDMAVAHIAHGSNVTQRSQSVSRSLASAADAARMAMSSACAVGSRSAMTRLPARATTFPSRTIAQPTGTSPRAPAAWASSRAICMNEGINRHGRACPGHPRLLCRTVYKHVDAWHKAGHDESEHMSDKSHLDTSGERVAKVI